MFVELFTGHDTFRAQQNSAKRNAQVFCYTRVDNDGEGNQIIPLFAAFTKKMKGFGKQSLISRLPATSQFSMNDAGEWFKTRYEVAPSTEIMVEYRHRSGNDRFDNTEYFLFVADTNAALLQVRIDLPDHYLAAQNAAFFEGRFDVVRDDMQLSKQAIKAWSKKFGFDEAFPFAFNLDPVQPAEDQQFKIIELERAAEVKKSVSIVKAPKTGEDVVRIKRLRNIKVPR